MKKLVIDESKWWRGKGSEGSCLLRADGMMCCLGFFELANGKSEKEITDASLPSEVESVERLGELGLGEWVEDHFDKSFEDDIAEVNDDPALDDAERKGQLAPMFAKLGWELEFIPGGE